jgi:hypothetical protein
MVAGGIARHTRWRRTNLSIRFVMPSSCPLGTINVLGALIAIYPVSRTVGVVG